MGYEKFDYDMLQARYGDILKKLQYIECDIGWSDIIDKALSDILNISYEAGVDVQIVQIKEKFAGLRIYFDLEEDSENNQDVYDKINDIVYNAEKESYTVCEICGEKGKVIKKGWWKTLCISHEHNLG
jgi:hypothetical protein